MSWGQDEEAIEDPMSNSVLVTGGGGFIGTWVLRDLLSRGMTPVVLDIQRNDTRWDRVLGTAAAQVTFVAGSMLDREILQRIADEHDISPIIHFNGNLRKIIRNCLLIGLGQNASTRTKNPDIR